MECKTECLDQDNVRYTLDVMLQHGGVAGDVFDGRQQVVLHPHEQSPLLPWVLEVQRFEVVPQAAFPVSFRTIGKPGD